MEETNWFHDLTTDEAKEERFYLVSWLTRVMVLIVALLIAVTWSTGALAAPIYRAEAEGVVIILTDEDCKLPEVSNLKKRAVWKEGGQSFEGCWGSHPAFPLVVTYFSDRTVVVVPLEMFVPVHDA